MHRLCLALLALLLSATVAAQEADIPVPAPPELGAASYILMDYHTGKVLVDQASDAQREPASLTKLMTAYVVFAELEAGHIALDDQVLISEKAWRAPGSRTFLEVGDRVKLETLLRGMIIQSGNDASIALAEHVAGTEETFAQVMNQYAQRLGMDKTQYRNSTGLPEPGHHSTARDTAILSAALIRDFPEYYKYYSQRSFSWNGIEQYNRNKLLWRNEAVDGLKTGHTEAAGYCLASSAEKEGMRLIAVVMGASSAGQRIQQSQSLLSYGFRFYRTHRLYTGGEELTRPQIWKGAAETVPLGLAEDLYVTIPARAYDDLEANMRVDSNITAPVASGERHGTVAVTLNGKTLAESPLVALEDVAEGGLWDRMVDNVWLMFE